jgi:hypothetical protein
MDGWHIYIFILSQSIVLFLILDLVNPWVLLEIEDLKEPLQSDSGTYGLWSLTQYFIFQSGLIVDDRWAE